MINYTNREIWLVTGSQHLYGDETLRQVAEHSQQIARALDTSSAIAVKIVWQPTVKTTDEIYQLIQKANADDQVIGLIAWMHTFSPAKMWIRGLTILHKPLLHLHTQFNQDIPWATMDMDFMNLNQSAHGDREFGYIVSRLGIDRKVVVGHWKSETVQKQIGQWARVTAGWADWQGAKFARFGDNMRFVAVTEGDKVAAEAKLGFSVNTYGIGDLVEVMKEVSDKEIDTLVSEYEDSYKLAAGLSKEGAQRAALRDAAKIELGLRHFLKAGDFKGFTDTFEDLHGMRQLPGIAVQRLMADGYGFAGEGDWKTAALVRAMKVMGYGLKGANAFMEDYTYHLDPSDTKVMGSHMLEVDPTLASGDISCEIHPLGIGGKEDPVRLVFNGGGGAAIASSLVDMGGRFRLVANAVEGVAINEALPKLPVARIMWKPLPDFQTACAAWILAGGAHHTCYSQNLSMEQIEDFADIAGIETVIIDQDTSLRQIKKELKFAQAYYH
ncbi:L-arabinose isomerase [Arachidicoccus ginsenosidivorans]|uniref:L-arabinose isomerase n=1 Tax=Arachidicoccus ginsenosidivorans TaxID=496057 RepID=A0A5B8VI48_9BACT|nr:L-arabinose isomerase [Arachidicoccus ginsenosidivorans]QEC71224.1 L-arabinose isomerase [Arachidicoccus ginsenosidivorans]